VFQVSDFVSFKLQMYQWRLCIGKVDFL
jgi:hypothetical protein